jgi:hypothetical protein
VAGEKQGELKLSAISHQPSALPNSTSPSTTRAQINNSTVIVHKLPATNIQKLIYTMQLYAANQNVETSWCIIP